PASFITHVYGRSRFVYGANSRSTSDDVATLSDDETVVAAEFLERALQPIGGPQYLELSRSYALLTDSPAASSATTREQEPGFDRVL
ncbi:MAG TPA: hypothetical protein VES20_16510, partial [Bryobacteraceae bacterium]|nr:hypothetical protein [Bryobacteraceae bacterium]